MAELTIQALESTFFNDKEYGYLRNIVVKNGSILNTRSPFETHSIALLPIVLFNKDKTLKITTKPLRSLSGSEAQHFGYYLALPEEQSEMASENNLTLRIVDTNRGYTLLYKYLEERNYTYLDKISLYIQTNINHKIRVYNKANHTVIITNNMELDTVRRIFSAIPLIYKNSLTFTDKTLRYFKAFTENDAEIAAVQLLQEIIEDSGILEELKSIIKIENLTKVLGCKAKKYESRRIELLKNIEFQEAALKENYNALQETLALITFNEPKENIKEVLSYIEKNPYIVDYFTTETQFALAIEAPIDYLDTKALKRTLQNPNAYIYPRWEESNNSQFPKELKDNGKEFLNFLKDIFIGDRFKVFARAEICFNLENSSATPLAQVSAKGQRPKSWNILERIKTDRTIAPHMHIEGYNCWSGNKANISKRLAENDLIGAIDIAVNTVKDLNVNDGAVFNRFIKHGLYNVTPLGCDREIQLPLGTQLKTIYDSEQKKFRTFNDIFFTEYTNKQNEVIQDNEVNEINEAIE